MKFAAGTFLLAIAAIIAMAYAESPAPEDAVEHLLSGKLHWSSSPPLVEPMDRGGDHYYSVKDPSFVQVGGRWHLFCTVRGKNRSHQIEYLAFDDWNQVSKGERHMLQITDGYYCAPQVFYFTPHKKWYLIYQDAGGPDRLLRPSFSTNDQVGEWKSWTRPTPLFDTPGQRVKNWIDFWVICDDRHAYLFFTCNDGTMWRARTKLADFPHGWEAPKFALRDDIFEASHTYHLRGTGKYLTMVEAIGHGRRYYKAYVANELDGEWKPLAATWDKPFAGTTNVAQPAGHWADSISHGELFRAGIVEKMEVDPADLRLLFQGVLDEGMKDKPYGQIPWRLGILRLDH